MHQEHNIAWNKLASNLTFISQNTHITPSRPDFFPRSQGRNGDWRISPNQIKDLEFFISSVIKSITTFSQTERAKYASVEEIKKQGFPTSGKLYQDELRERYPEFLNERNQMIQNWIGLFQEQYRRSVAYHRAHSVREDGTRYPSLPDGHFTTYSTLHCSDFADVVKILIQENQLETLLMLSHHPQIPLAHLHNMNGFYLGHGWNRIMDCCIPPYIYFNALAATGVLLKRKGHTGGVSGTEGEGVYKESNSFKSLLVLQSPHKTLDLAVQQILHRAFLGCTQEDHDKIDLARDYDKLHQYLKDIFALLYRYDVLAKECGVEVDWRGQMVYDMYYMFGFRGHEVLDEKTGKWEVRFC